MSHKILISLAAATFGLVALTSTGASAGSYGHHYSKHCYKKAVKVPYWYRKKVAVPYGCGWKTIKVRGWRTVWRRVCH